MTAPRFALGLMVLASLSLASCGGHGRTPVVHGPTTFPDSPDGTQNKLVKELWGSGNVRAAWDALPVRHQKDVSDLVHSFGRKMDAEVHQKLFEAFRSALDLALEKKSIVHELLQKSARLEPAELKSLEKKYDSIIALLKEAAESEIADTSKLASLDLPSFLGGKASSLFSKLLKLANTSSGPDILTFLFGGLGRWEYRVGEERDGVVILHAFCDGSRLKWDCPLIKVDGKWMDPGLAKDWPKMMKEAKEWIAKLDLSKDKKLILDSLDKFEKLIGKLKAAETAEDFKRIVQSSAMDFLPTMSLLRKYGLWEDDGAADPAEQPKQERAKQERAKQDKKAMKRAKQGAK
ncbi:MAG: hypothetical protein CSA62_06680 [Planctomycetota bacterium]|nr:MAG: hypothetical protein CSA62_06680 [Planctomycetota bacterium]